MAEEKDETWRRTLARGSDGVHLSQVSIRRVGVGSN